MRITYPMVSKVYLHSFKIKGNLYINLNKTGSFREQLEGPFLFLLPFKGCPTVMGLKAGP